MNLFQRLKFEWHRRKLLKMQAARRARIAREERFVQPRAGMIFGAPRTFRGYAPKSLSGFTLIELMVSIAIVAILAGAAAYAYSGFSNNAQVAEAIRMADGAQLAVAQSYQANGIAPGNAAEAGVNQNPGKYVASENVGTSGVVWEVFNAVNPSLNGLVLVHTPYTSTADPSAPIVWTCGYATPQAGWVALPAGTTNPPPAASTVPSTYLPRNCRAGG